LCAKLVCFEKLTELCGHKLKIMKLDILAFAAHPDDVELSCSGTIVKHIKLGMKVGVIDLTKGELGTRGSSVIREKEADNASVIMGLSVRENLGMADGFFEISQENKMQVVRMIRKYQPRIVLANAIHDRHPDHGRASKLVSDACFLAGLIKIETSIDGQKQQAWRPEAVYNYIQDRRLKPDFIVDISEYIDVRIAAIMAYSSQFYNPQSTEPDTAISSKQFMEILTSRAMDFGRLAGFEYGEGFTTERPIGVNTLVDLK
jgi:N-acetylglucosamine malate deacetylase 1